MSERTIVCENCGLSAMLNISIFYNPANNTLPEDDPFYLHNPECPSCHEYMRGDVEPKISLQQFLDVIKNDYSLEIVPIS